MVFEHVEFGYQACANLRERDGGSVAEENVTFQGEPGQTVVIVGQTGSGKSSMVILINRIYDMDHA